jgi:hypothetical protein
VAVSAPNLQQVPQSLPGSVVFVYALWEGVKIITLPGHEGTGGHAKQGAHLETECNPNADHRPHNLQQFLDRYPLCVSSPLVNMDSRLHRILYSEAAPTIPPYG